MYICRSAIPKKKKKKKVMLLDEQAQFGNISYSNMLVQECSGAFGVTVAILMN